jgi:O-antigen/teichoic acid export membrane protein
VVLTLLSKSRDLVSRALKGGFFHLYGANLLILASSFGLQIFVAHLLPAATLGNLKVMQSYFSLLYIVASLGFNLATFKIASEKLSPEELDRVLKTSLVYSTLGVVLCVLGVFALNVSVGLSANSTINEWVVIFVWSIPLMVYSQLAISYMQARKQFKEVARVNSTSKVLAVIFGVLLTWMFGAYGFISGLLLGYTLTLFLYVRHIGTDVLRSPMTTANAQRLRSLAFFAILANGVGQLNNQMDLLLLDRLVTDRSLIGSYSLAAIFFAGLIQLTGTVQAIMIPAISEISEDFKAVKRVFWRYLKALFGASLAVALVAIVVVPAFVSFVYGDKYQGFDDIFLVMVLRFVLYGPCSMVGATFIAIGRIDRNVVVSLASLPVMGGATVLLVGWYGVYGAVWAQIVGILFLTVLGGLLLSNELNSTPSEQQSGLK